MPTQVAYHLQAVIYRWVGAEAGSYGLITPMGSLWARRFPAVSYDPEGIRHFMMTMYQDMLFGHCGRAHQIVPGMFEIGGPLQRVGDVYNFLAACENVHLGFGTAILEAE